MHINFRPEPIPCTNVQYLQAVFGISYDQAIMRLENHVAVPSGNVVRSVRSSESAKGIPDDLTDAETILIKRTIDMVKTLIRGYLVKGSTWHRLRTF